MNIDEIIKSAKSKILIVGVVGNSRVLISSVADALKTNPALKCTILTESENYIFNKALLTDNVVTKSRKSFKVLLHEQRRIIEDLPKRIPNDAEVNIQICYLDIPIRIIKADDVIYVNYWVSSPNDKYEELNANVGGHDSIHEFITMLETERIGGKLSAPYRNSKGEITETIEAFDENRIRRGIYPRSSFYDSDLIKLVVWVFIFDRNGKMLIHKRSANAKDNQDMWDKSVGGHADYLVDTDTSKTVPREVIEELITNETVKSQFIQTNDTDVVFLGEWKPEQRYDNPFYEIRNGKDQWVYFRLPESYRTISPRILPDGTSRRNEVIADVYLFIFSEGVSKKTIQAFENSDYKLIEPTLLKTVIENSEEGISTPSFSGDAIPKFSPDLKYAFSSKLRDRLEEFQSYIFYNLGDD